MKIRHVFAYVAFACLLFSQQLGIAHAVSHLSQNIGGVQEKQLPAELQCEQCVTFAAFGSALTGSPPPGPTFFAQRAVAAEPLRITLLPAEARPFDSRAPPVPV